MARQFEIRQDLALRDWFDIHLPDGQVIAVADATTDPVVTRYPTRDEFLRLTIGLTEDEYERSTQRVTRVIWM